MVALGFDYTNGFHDSANAIATSVSTRALTPRVALLMAAVMNLLGAWLGLRTQGRGQDRDQRDHQRAAGRPPGLVIVFAALVGAIAWNLVTWYFGLPSSSLARADRRHGRRGLASADSVKWPGSSRRSSCRWWSRRWSASSWRYLLMVAHPVGLPPGQAHARSTTASGWRRSVSAAAMALGHGIQDAQKTMGVIMLALIAGAP